MKNFLKTILLIVALIIFVNGFSVLMNHFFKTNLYLTEIYTLWFLVGILLSSKKDN